MVVIWLKWKFINSLKCYCQVTFYHCCADLIHLNPNFAKIVLVSGSNNSIFTVAAAAGGAPGDLAVRARRALVQRRRGAAHGRGAAQPRRRALRARAQLAARTAHTRTPDMWYRVRAARVSLPSPTHACDRPTPLIRYETFTSAPDMRYRRVGTPRVCLIISSDARVSS